mmetsp:Transcript_32444/g.87104  ORF Transcript_32444/g.87104 Transcript_32444/m.87104 type:complete len:106 (+) Transcript_32444:412-729(+)
MPAWASEWRGSDVTTKEEQKFCGELRASTGHMLEPVLMIQQFLHKHIAKKVLYNAGEPVAAKVEDLLDCGGVRLCSFRPAANCFPGPSVRLHATGLDALGLLCAS